MVFGSYGYFLLLQQDFNFAKTIEQTTRQFKIIHNSFQTYIEPPLLNASFLSLLFVVVFCFVVVAVAFICLFVCCFFIWFKVSLLSTANVPCAGDLFKTKLFAFNVLFLVCLTRQ